MAGGGIYCDGSSPRISNSIFWNNGSEIVILSGNAKVSFSNIQGGFRGTGNIDTDPLFLDPSTDDYHLEQDPCEVGIVNPCVDTGDPDSPTPTGSTRSDSMKDLGLPDMGYHYPLEWDTSRLHGGR